MTSYALSLRQKQSLPALRTLWSDGLSRKLRTPPARPEPFWDKLIFKLVLLLEFLFRLNSAA